MKMKNTATMDYTRRNKGEETVNVSHHHYHNQRHQRSKEPNQKWKCKESWVSDATGEKKKKTSVRKESERRNTKPKILKQHI